MTSQQLGFKSVVNDQIKFCIAKHLLHRIYDHTHTHTVIQVAESTVLSLLLLSGRLFGNGNGECS
jgi:hypothetical protein